MAVVIKKKSLTLMSLLTRLFTAEDLTGHDFMKKAQELEIQGYKLKTGILIFSIEVDMGKEMVTVSQVPLKLDTVILAMKKKLGYTTEAIIKDKVRDLIHAAYDKYCETKYSDTGKIYISPEDAKEETVQVWLDTQNKIKMISKFLSLTDMSLKEAKEACEDWINAIKMTMPASDFGIDFGVEGGTEEKVKTKLNINELPELHTQTVYGVCTDLNQAPVTLKKAQKLNQPVCGTSGGSIYHVIAIGSSCVVAVRIKKNNEIAIRAEMRCPPNSTEGKKVKSGLIFAGLEKKNSGHFSLHLNLDDSAMGRRSIGSTIMAMGIPFWGVTTDLHTLQGVGK